MRIYDAKDISRSIVKTFKDRDVEWEKRFKFSWPKRLQHVGDSLAVAYSSDKWEKGPYRKNTAYKHVAESRNLALVKPGLLVDYHKHDKKWPVFGPIIHLDDFDMPDSVAVLGLFEEIDLHLFNYVDPDGNGVFEDENVVKVTLRHGMLAGGELRHDGLSRTFLVVYNETQGVQILVLGVELGIEKDGVVG